MSALSGRGRRRKACALDGRGTLQRRLPRADVPRAAAARPARLRASKGAEARPAGAGRGACGPGPAFLGRESALNNHYLPDLCASHVPTPARLPPPARARIVLPRAAPRCAAARTPRTGYCGRRRRSDRPFRTGFSRWLGGKRRLSPKPPSFKSSLNPFHFNFEVLLWTESSILAQDERWRRA